MTVAKVKIMKENEGRDLLSQHLANVEYNRIIINST